MTDQPLKRNVHGEIAARELLPTEGRTYEAAQVHQFTANWQQQNSELRGQIERLQDDNRQLRDRVRDLTRDEPDREEEHTRRPPRRRLKTRDQALRAIREVIYQMQEGTIAPNDARARLYAFQTLLVAMQIGQSTPKPPVKGTIQACADYAGET